jgi:hypothetical protein
MEFSAFHKWEETCFIVEVMDMRADSQTGISLIAFICT